MMIFTKYLVEKMLKNQLIVLVILFLVFFSQKIIKVLPVIVNSSVPKFFILVFFLLGIPEIIKLILPLSLFFGILITFNYLRSNNEIIAIYSCGLGNVFLFRSIFFLISIITFFSMVNTSFLSPFCLRYQNRLLLKYQSNFNEMKLFGGQFQFLKHVNSVFFFDSFCGEKFKNVFLIRFIPNSHFSVISANYGYIEKVYDGTQWIVLTFGDYYSWNKDSIFNSNVYINHFYQYKVLINSKIYYCIDNDLFSRMFMCELWHSSLSEARAELHWRLTLVLAVFIMAMIIFPLSLIRLNNNYLISVLPALILYLLFFSLQVFLRFNVSKGSLEPIWIWLINFLYIFISVVLNFWDSVIFRDFRWKLKLVL